MKKAILSLSVALGIAIIASIAVFFIVRKAPLAPNHEVGWLKNEFQLNEQQFSEVERLHQAFMPECEIHCERYAQAKSRVDSLLDNGARMTPDLESALQQLFQSELECRTATIRHAYDVAAVMPPEQGRRYLSIVWNYLNRSGHAVMMDSATAKPHTNAHQQ